MKAPNYVTMICFFLICSFFVYSDHDNNHKTLPPKESSLNFQKNFYELGIKELTLKNGLKVVLKHTDFEDDEISIRMTAFGGYASEPSSHRASAELSPQIAWESGIGEYCCDKLSVLLWTNSIEMDFKVSPYSRGIQATARPESLDTLFHVIEQIFTNPHFTQKGLESVVAVTSESLRKRFSDHDTTYEDVYRSLNTENFHAFRPLSQTDLQKIDLNTVKEFYSKAFSNPSDFVLVIVGNFNNDTIMESIEKHLTFVPRSESKFDTTIAKFPNFPDGTSGRNIKVKTRVHCLTRLTFPVNEEMDENKYWALNLLSQVIEARLRKVILHKMKTTYAIDVSYEFPLYPKLDKPWITVQYKCEPEKNGIMRKLIIAELKTLQDAGPTKDELEQVRKQMEKSDDYWLKDNDYWVSVLSNYYSWGWDPTGMIKNYDKEPLLKIDNMKKILKTYISINNYSKLTAEP